jgi:hypothetical protein
MAGASALAVMLMFLAGCDLYLGDHDEKPPCAFGGDPIPMINPYTGLCETWGSPSCGYELNGGAADAGPRATPPEANWAICYSECTGLVENTCLETAGCRANYLLGGQRFQGCTAVAPWGHDVPHPNNCADLDAQGCTQTDQCSSVYNRPLPSEKIPPVQSFFERCQDETPAKGCFSDQDCGPGYECTSDTECLPPPGCGQGQACPPVCYGRCVKIDVPVCAPDSCPIGTVCAVACPDPGMGMPGQSVDETCSIQCIPEPQSCAVVDCAPGYTCVEQCKECPPNADCSGLYLCEAVCVPSEPVTCDNVTCQVGSHCEVSCQGGMNPDGPPTMGGCTAVCVDDTPDPGTCDGLVACDAAPPACPAGTVAGVRNACWTGYCIPVSDCGPLDSGVCGVNAVCATPPPVCPPETQPGVKNGCWSGYCIPSSQCAATECSMLTEQTCTTRPDCTAVYTGDACTCYPWGCSCETTTYARCEVALTPLPL